MNEATYATLRDASGITPERLATSTGVPLQTVLSWEQPGGDPPPNVQQYIESITTNQAKSLSEIIAIAQAGAPVYLMRYHDEIDYHTAYGTTAPLEVYNRLVSTAHAALTAIGARVHVHYFNPPAYSRWLGPRPDTEANRISWLESLTATEEAASQLPED